MKLLLFVGYSICLIGCTSSTSLAARPDNSDDGASTVLPEEGRGEQNYPHEPKLWQKDDYGTKVGADNPDYEGPLPDAEEIARGLTRGVETHLNKTHGKQNVSGKCKMLSSSLRPVSQSNVYSYTNMRQI